MKRTTLLALVLVALIALVVFADPPPPPNEWGHTWGASLTMNVGDTLDVIATFPAELTDGWLEATGTMKVNGYVTTFAAFKDTSTMNLEAIGSVTLSLYGK